MLALKLQRIGKKHQPSYRLVVAEKRSKMAAPPVEDLGSYNPSLKTASFNKERALHWMKVGAEPTATVHNLLVSHGILTTPKRMIKMKKAVAPAAVAEAPAPAAEAPAVKEEAVVAEPEAKAEEPVVEAAPASEEAAA